MLSTDSLFWTYLLTGLTIGFGHCIGMCGPVVISFSLNWSPRAFHFPQLLYHCGRTLTYMLLGALMGATGSFSVVAAHLSILQKGAMFLTGGVIVAMGLAMGGWIPRLKIFDFHYSPGGVFTNLVKKLSHTRSAGLYLPLGLMLGLLPCGPVYTALLGAARAGMESPDPYQGALTGMSLMLAFSMGTIPALYLVANLANLGQFKFREKIYKAGAALMVGVGIYFLYSAYAY